MSRCHYYKLEHYDVITVSFCLNEMKFRKDLFLTGRAKALAYIFVDTRADFHLSSCIVDSQERIHTPFRSKLFVTMVY